MCCHSAISAVSAAIMPSYSCGGVCRRIPQQSDAAALLWQEAAVPDGATVLCESSQFYAMVNFCNPGVLGTPAEFRKRYERPILEGREPGAGQAKVVLHAFSIFCALLAGDVPATGMPS